MFNTREEIEAAFVEVGHPAIGAAAAALAKPSGRFTVSADGAHRTGGTARLPAGSTWPVRAPLPHQPVPRWYSDEPKAAWTVEMPLVPVAEIDLDELAEQLPESPLPKHGRLAVFWEQCTGPFGQELRNTYVTHITGGVEDLEPPASLVLWPLQKRAILRAWSAPSHDALTELSPVALPEYGTDERFYELFDSIDDWGWSTSDRVLGWSTPTQYEPFLDAYAVVNGLQDVPVRWLQWHEVSGEYVNHNEWTLLVQVSLAEASEDEFAEGTLYVYVPTSDALAGVFDRSVGIYQQT